MPTPTTFDGVTVNGASAYRLTLESPVGRTEARTTETTLRIRTSQMPARDLVTFGARLIPFKVSKAANAAGAALGTGPHPASFVANVERYFSPHVETERVLNATHNDGSTALTLNVVIKSLVPDGTGFSGLFETTEPAWRSTTTNTDSASPLSVGGTYKALPVITVTPDTSTVRRRRITIADNSTRGLHNYIVQITFDSTGVSAAAAADYIVFHKGRSIPFYVNTPNDAATKLYCRVDVPAGGESFVDIFYGSSVANTITADALDDGGMDLTSASFSNTNWVWDAAVYTGFLTNPNTNGVWRPAKIGQNVSGTTFGITAVTATTVKFEVLPSSAGTLASDADAMVLVVPCGTGTTNALSGMTAAVGITANTARGRLLYRIAGQINWTEKESRTTTGNLTFPSDIDNAVEIALVIEALDTTGNASLTISGTLALVLDSTKTPTVTVGSAGTARVIDDVLTNGTTGDTIDFDEVYLDDVALTINCLTKRITVASGPLYKTGITFSDRHDWFDLPHDGSVTWTEPANSSISLSWANRYRL